MLEPSKMLGRTMRSWAPLGLLLVCLHLPGLFARSISVAEETAPQDLATSLLPRDKPPSPSPSDSDRAQPQAEPEAKDLRSAPRNFYASPSDGSQPAGESGVQGSPLSWALPSEDPWASEDPWQMAAAAEQDYAGEALPEEPYFFSDDADLPPGTGSSPAGPSEHPTGAEHEASLSQKDPESKQPPLPNAGAQGQASGPGPFWNLINRIRQSFLRLRPCGLLKPRGPGAGIATRPMPHPGGLGGIKTPHRVPGIGGNINPGIGGGNVNRFPGIGGNVNRFPGISGGTINRFPGMGGRIINGIPGISGGNINGIPGLGGGIVNRLPGIGGGIINGIPGLGGGIVNRLPGIGGGIINGIPGIGGGNINGIPGLGGGIVNRLPGIGGGIINGIPGIGGGNINGIPGIGGGIVNRLPGIAGGIINGIPGIGGGNINGIPGIGGGIVNRLPGIAGGIINGIPGIRGGNINGIPGIGGGIINRIPGIGGGNINLQSGNLFPPGVASPPGSSWNVASGLPTPEVAETQ